MGMLLTDWGDMGHWQYLPVSYAGYTAGAGKVIWVVGAQKIVDDLDEGFKRVYDYVLPIESEKLKKLYGVDSNVSKLLIFNKEVVKDRVTLIFVNEVLGY